MLPNTVFSRSLSFKFGPIAILELSSRYQLDGLDQKIPYSHPYLRFAVDDLTATAVSLIPKPFCDLGSKYHKIARMWTGTFHAYRSKIFDYDE